MEGGGTGGGFATKSAHDVDMRLIRLVVPIVIVLALAALVIRPWWRAASRGRRPNIILISLDTTRADRLSCYGHRMHVTPNIDAVAAGATRFTDVLSPVPLTLPAHCSMMTGTTPPRHGVHDNIFYRLGEDNVTLAERLKEAGYDTAAVIGAFVLDAKFGLDQGFDFYEDELTGDLTFSPQYAERRAEDVAGIATEWLGRPRTRPFFLFVHFYDPHHPYRPPAPFSEVYADDLYTGEVAYTDESVGRIISRVKELDLYEDSLVIITSDHGEGLGEHEEAMHGYFIYHSTTKVPLIVKLPDQKTARRVDEKVALIDLFPTVVQLLELPVTDELQGRSFLLLLQGGSGRADERFFYCESLLPTRYGCNSLLAVETKAYRYIQTTHPELYDLVQDAGETVNLFETQPQRAAAYQDELRAVLEQSLPRASVGTVALDEESRKRLASLGYVDSGQPVVETFAFDTSRRDPKGFLPTFTKIEGVDYALHTGRLAEAESRCREVLAEYPDLAFVHAKLGDLVFKQGRPAETLTHFTRAVELDPDWGELRNNLGALLIQFRRYDEAIEHLQHALALSLGSQPGLEAAMQRLTQQPGRNPAAFRALLNLAAAFGGKGDAARAFDAASEAAKLAPPQDTHALFQLGMTWRNLGRAAEAVKCFHAVLSIEPGNEAARGQLAAMGEAAPTSP